MPRRDAWARAAGALVLAAMMTACGGGSEPAQTNPSPPAATPAPPAAAEPQVASIAPTRFVAPARLEVSGSGLDAVVRARLNGTPLTIVAQTAARLSLDVPAGATSGFLTLVDAAGAERQAAQPLTVLAPLAITALTPSSVLTGASLTIAGTGLDRATTVEFGGGAFAEIGARPADALTVTVPVNAVSGTVSVHAGLERATSAVALTVIPRIVVSNPVTVAVAPGGSVTLNGSGFTEVSGVLVAGTPAVISARSATQLTFSVPAGVSCGPIVLQSASQPAVTGGAVAVGGGCALRIEAIEFAQVLSQTAADPRLRLVPRRETWVRAYVLAGAAGAASPSVTLSAYAGAVPLGTVRMTGPSQVPVLAVGSPLPDSLRYSQSQTWLARLDDAWVVPGLRVEITADAEQRLGAPVVASASPAVGTGTRIDLVLVPLVSGANTPTVPSNAAALVRDELIRRMPVAAGDIAVTVRHPYTLTSVTDGVDTATDWSRALAELEQLRDRESPDRHYYGLVRPMASAGTAGIGYVNGVGASSPALAALGWDASRSGSWLRTLVHELGHNFSRLHAPCGAVGSFDSGYPYANGALGSTPLFDALSDLLVTPSGADVMGYCNGSWFSDYNLREVQRFLEARPQATASRAADGDAVRSAAAKKVGVATNGEVLIVAGRITLTGVELAPVQVTRAAAPTVPAAGEFLLQMVTVSGEVVEVPFDTVTVDHALPPERHFLVRVARPGAIAALRVKKGSSVLAQLSTASAAAPAAAPAQPVAASVLTEGGRVTLRWDAARHRYASLTHIAGDVRTVVMLGVRDGMAETRAELPPGGEFELALSDGLNTALLRLPRP